MGKRHGAQKTLELGKCGRVFIKVEEPEKGLKINLPFIMGVMADLSGDWEAPEDVKKEHRTARGEISERAFREIDTDNFTALMETCRPTVRFTVPNVLDDQGGQIPVNLTFNSMEDFEPDKIAERMEPLKSLYELRQALKYILTGAENNDQVRKQLEKLVTDPEMMRAVLAVAKLKEDATAKS